MKYYFNFMIVILLLSGGINISAQENFITYGNYQTLKSDILGEERRILVKLPYGYESGNKQYPVLYQLDGYKSRYLIGISALQQLMEEERVPEFIYVAIENTDRNRDMFPYKTKYHRSSGGAANFLNFISDELIPYVDKNYRTTGNKSIMGFSTSGHFLLYALFTKPLLFNTYILNSPSIAFKYDFYEKGLEKLFSENEYLPVNLTITWGSQEGKAFYGDQYYFDIDCIKDLIPLFKEKAPTGFDWRMKEIRGAVHASLQSFYEGTRKAYEGWQAPVSPVIFPSGGYTNPDESFTVNIEGKEDNIRYTLDGSEPDGNSLLYSSPLTLSSPVTVKAKVFQKDLAESEMVTAEFKSISFQKELDIKEKLSQGINFKYYEDYYFRFGLPDFNSLSPLQEGVAQKINLDVKNRDEGFALNYQGLIKIEKSGYYTFYLGSNNASVLMIDGLEVISVPPFHNSITKSGLIGLDEGFHKIELKYIGPAFMKKLYLDLEWSGPGFERQSISTEVLYVPHGN